MRKMEDPDNEDQYHGLRQDNLVISLDAFRPEEVAVHVQRDYRNSFYPRHQAFDSARKTFGNAVSAVKIVIGKSAFGDQ